MAGSSLLDVHRASYFMSDQKQLSNMSFVSPLSLDASSYTRILEQMAKLYPYDPAAVAASISAMGYSSPRAPNNYNASLAKGKGVDRECPPTNSYLKNTSKLCQTVKNEREDLTDSEEALDLSTQNSKSTLSNFPRILLSQVKPKVVEDVWVVNDVTLAWTDSKIAAYNPAQKLFLCVDCECVGFLSRVAEHWLGAHANLRVFHCPRCPYTSAWSRCVKMHLTRQHSEQFADTTMWKGNATLLEVTRLMQELRTKVETKIDANNLLTDKRFYCPYCPYATDRRDLYTRHENIHKDNKPFHCYLCFKQFNRADHVKKHFVRMHAEAEYDISKIRKNQSSNKNKSVAQVEDIKSKLLVSSMPQNSNSEAVEGKTPLNISSAKIDANLSSINCSDKFATQSSVDINPVNFPYESVTVKEVREVASISSVKSSFPDVISRKKRWGEKAYSCHYCHWSGSDNWCLKRHMNTHIKPFACIMCDYKAARAERLSTHVWKVHNKRICNKCNFLAETQERLLEHTREEHHNNPYSKRHICASCGLSFDTRANLETHIHLAHTRPKSPNDIAKITPILSSEAKREEQAQELTIKLSLPYEEEKMALICPVEDCGAPCNSSGTLADHVRMSHGGLFASRCPHCGYSLTQDELAKDHWLTHHEDVCCACVHVFTSVYGPQLWKKVHVQARSNDSPLNAIVIDLNKRRCVGSPLNESSETEGELPVIDSNCAHNAEHQTQTNASSISATETEIERNLRRQRKQSCPMKLITVSPIEEKNSSNQILRTHQPKTKLLTKKRTKRVRRIVKKRRCLRCPHRPIFNSYSQLLSHCIRKHKITHKYGRGRTKMRLSIS